MEKCIDCLYRTDGPVGPTNICWNCRPFGTAEGYKSKNEKVELPEKFENLIPSMIVIMKTIDSVISWGECINKRIEHLEKHVQWRD